MGRTYRIYLAGEVLMTCRECGNHLAVSEAIMSRQFTGQHGRALLMHTVVNCYTGNAEIREMRTGKHSVRDVYCRVCDTTIGWKYDIAYEADQKYKEGKYILEKAMIVEREEDKSLLSSPPAILETSGREILARL